MDFEKIKNSAISERVWNEGADLVSHCHFGVQGLVKTENDVMKALNRLLDTGFKPVAFDTEPTFVRMIKGVVGDSIRLHCAVSYPLGRMTLKKKMMDLNKLIELGVEDTCVCLDWQAIFSHRWGDVEKEAAEIMKEFDGKFYKNAFVIPATLLSDTEMIEVMKTLDSAGVYSVKVNPGCKLGVSYEEVMLIKRNFPNRFDIHPSGNIRTLEQFERYRALGCEVIHTASTLDIANTYMERQARLYGGLEA